MLVQRLLARDERALRLLEVRYGSNLRSVIGRVVGNRELVEDLLQEGLLKVWTSIASYDAEKGRLFTWMVRVCCNQAIDALRSPRHRFHKGTQSLEAAAAQQTPAPVSFNPEHIGVRELTQRLKPRQLAVIDLLYFGGCTQVEAAQELNIPLATVKTRARAALVALALLLPLAGSICHLVVPLFPFPFAPLGTVLNALGMLVVGIAAFRVGLWTGWQRFAPLGMGLFNFTVQLPLLLLLHTPPYQVIPV